MCQDLLITNIYFEAVVPAAKKNFFHKFMIELVNILELNDQNYQTNGTVRSTKYKVKFLFYMGFYFIWNISSINVSYVNQILKI